MKDIKDFSRIVKDRIDASGIKEKIQDATQKAKVDAVVSGIQKGIVKISGDESILSFSKVCSNKYIEIGEAITITIKLQSRRRAGLLDCIVTDEIPPQFELIGDMPDMVCQLAPGEEKEYQYRIRANTGGHFSTRAVCEIENKFSLDDLLSNEMEVYVSPLSIQMKAQEMIQEQWKPLDCIFKNISKENIASITVSLKENSKFELDKTLVCTEFLRPNQSVVIQPVLRTRESGFVSLNLDVVCIDVNGVKYHAEKDFLVQVMEADKTVTKVDIGSIGEVVSSGATQIKDSVIQRSTVGAAETGKTGDSSTKGRSIEVSDSIVQRSEIGGGADASDVERRCAKCNHKLQEGWRMCPFCGTELELKCSQCGQKVEAEWIACPFCGGKLK
ncbi:zinc ribbon domain-containing protein [Dehalococcoidia bacterium]|nr:zinc ribbon domain-containing protein [Dehalococcoidia bacterium]